MLMQVFVLALLCRTAASFNFYRSEYGADFDHFVFTQWWPQTQCQITYTHHHRTCSEPSLNKTCVPEGITKWTIHGLCIIMKSNEDMILALAGQFKQLSHEPEKFRPTVGVKHKPVWCNSSWPFNESVIEDLRPALEKQWPSYEQGYDNVELWKHEWDKHGTCCTNLPYLNTEHKYFYVALEMNNKYDIFSALESTSEIIPSSERTYQVKYIEEVLKDYFQVATRVGCYCRGSTQLLSYVELCLDKQLNLIDCPMTTSNCDYYESVQYPPIVSV